MRVDLREMTENPKKWAHLRPGKAEFGRDWPTTIKKLEYELDRIDVASVVIEVTGPRVEIRRDGWPSSRSVLDHPVIVSFEHPKAGPLQYRSGNYQVWHSNVHAVALTLERLRAIDRYGCAPSGQQYTGWAALPERASGLSSWDLIATAAGDPGKPQPVDSPTLHTYYRWACKKTHPDTADGSTSITFVQVLEAGKALGIS